MALGGGNWNTQDKVLPGTYINFSSAVKATSNLSERGIVAIPMALSWGPENTVFELSAETIMSDCKNMLGYSYSDVKMLHIRELFRNARKVLVYRPTTTAVKASNDIATARYAGTRGNNIKISMVVNVDNNDAFDVITYLDNQVIDTQTVSSADDLRSNLLVNFKPEIFLSANVGVSLKDGTDDEGITGAKYQDCLTALESYAFNILACPTADSDTINLFAAYTKRMNETAGANFQLVCYKPAAANSELIIGVENTVEMLGAEYALVYWTAGAEAACSKNESLTNKMYDGELAIDLAYTQSALGDAIMNGKLIFHSVSGIARVLEDINTLRTFTDTKGEDFKQNQCVRVLSGIANDIALLFNTRYLGIIANNSDGRISLWNDVCKILTEYERANALEEFNAESVKIVEGKTKKSVICTISGLTVVSAMTALYMDIVIA